MSSEIGFWALAPSGVRWAFCGYEHALNWKAATCVSQPDAMPGKGTLAPAYWCSHCSWCGERIHLPTTGICEQHGHYTACPDFRPEITELMRVTMRDLCRQHGPLPDRAWLYAADAALDLRDDHRWPDRGLLLRSIARTVADWPE